MEKKEVDFVDLLVALDAGKKLIIVGTLCVCILAAGLSFLLPNEYEAVVQLLPPKEQKQGLGFSDLLSALPIPSLRLGEKGTPADIYVAILKSPTIRRQMVKDFDLMAVYEAEKTVDALEALKGNTEVGKSEEGTIMIRVWDQEPKRAADMANHYVTLLDSTNRSLTRTSATERLDFINDLSERERGKLEDVMDRLQQFQADHNAISIEDQAKVVIKAAAEMQMTTMELNIARNSLLATGFSETHPEVMRFDQEILQRQQALALLRDGTTPTGIQPKRKTGPLLSFEENLFLPLKRIPEVAQEYANIETDVVVQGALMKLLLQQKAEALIEGSNTTSTVQVLDAATVPEKKAKPRRSLIVLMAGILSLFACSAYVLGSAYLQHLKQRWRQR